MKKILVLSILLFSIQSFSQEKNDCDERTLPYWANGINSRIEGENPALRKAFDKIQHSKTEIQPKKRIYNVEVKYLENRKALRCRNIPNR
jgi:hypothetical protein